MNADYGFGGAAPERYGALRDAERTALKRQSIRAGFCVAAFIILQYLIPFGFSASTILCDLYMHNDAFADLAEILFYLCTMLTPFLAAYALMKPTEKQEIDCFQKPVSTLSAVSAVISGFFFCTIGDIVNNCFVSLLEAFGFTLKGGVYDSPESGVQLVFSFLSIGILPAMVEEFALRGVIMQPMRHLGDKFAIIMSSFVFALMHGNLVQIPFAFIAGIAIGYYVIATGSIWVGIAIHMLNNSYSVILNYLLSVRPTAAQTMYSITNSAAIVLGVIATTCFFALQKRIRLQKPAGALTAGEKTTAYIFTIPMAAAIILLIEETCRYITYTGIAN